MPVSVVYADNSADYVHVDVLGAVYYGTLSDSSDGKSTIFTTVPESDLQFTITGKWDESASAFTQSCIHSIFLMVLPNLLNITKRTDSWVMCEQIFQMAPIRHQCLIREAL